jgi:hypothetical protein
MSGELVLQIEVGEKINLDLLLLFWLWFITLTTVTVIVGNFEIEMQKYHFEKKISDF